MHTSEKRLSGRWEFFCLTFIITAGCLIIFYRFLFCGDLFLYFGDANDDTFQSYLPAYQMIASKIRNLDFTFFDFTWGTGANILSSQGTLFDPFLLPVYLGGAVFGGEWIASALVWLQMLHIFGAGYAVLFYLKQFKLNEISRVIASAVFAFSAYSIGGIGQHYFFASFPFFMALFLGALEQAMHRPKRFAFLSIVTALICACSAYAAYMVLLTGGVYALLRCILSDECQKVEKVKRMAGLLLAVIIGILISAAVFFPVVYLLLFNSSRVQPTLDWVRWLRINSIPELKSIFLRFFSDTMEGSVNRWQGYATSFNVPHLYLSGLLVACIPQHIASLKQTEKKSRAGFLIGYTLFFASLLFPLVGVIYNMFTAYMGRYVFVFFPFAAYLIAKVITDAKEKGMFSRAAAGASVFLSVCACFLCNRSASSIIAAAAPAAAVIWLYCLAKKGTGKTFPVRKTAEGVLILFVCFAVVIAGWNSLYPGRGIVAKATYHAVYTDSVSGALCALQAERENSFYRTEYAYTGWASRPAFGNAMSMGYYGVGSYNSVTSERYQAYHRYFGNPYDNPYVSAVAYSYWQMGRPLDKVTADLWGIRYLVSTYPENDRDWDQTYVENLSPGSFWILENPDMDSAGTVFYAWYPETELEHMTDLQRQLALSQAVSLDAVPTHIPAAALSSEGTGSAPYPENRLEISDDGLEIVISDMIDALKSDGARYWLVFEAEAERNTGLTVLSDAGSGYGDNSGQNGVYLIRPEDSEKEFFLPVCENVSTVFFSLPDGQAVSLRNLRVVSCGSDNYTTNNIHSALPGRSNRIVSAVLMERDGIFVMPVCADLGWKASVDGVPASVLTADKCFLAVELAAGEHEVVFEYQTPFFRFGAAVSLIGILALAALYYVCKNKAVSKKA